LIGGRLLLRGLAVAALLAGAYALERHIEQRGYDRAAAEYTAAIQKLQAEAATTLAAETAKTRSAEQELATAKNNQELKDATHQKTIAGLSDRLRSAAGPAGRLRDPNATQCGGSGGSPPGDPATATAAGPTDGGEAGGLLSEQLTQFLFEQAASADELNNAYISCRADAMNVRSQGFPGK
jgi:hypothetical protein